MVLIPYKVLHIVHSDTIACVLYELLVCRSLGFGIVYRDFPSRLRFHKFQYCSIFKVLLALLSDSSIIISKVVLFVKHFFDIFLSLPNAFLKAFHLHAIRFRHLLYVLAQFIHDGLLIKSKKGYLIKNRKQLSGLALEMDPENKFSGMMQ